MGEQDNTNQVTSTQSKKAARVTKSTPSKVVYLLGKGTSRLLNARVNREEIHLLVNGPTMLYSSGRLLSSLDMAEGATFHAWTRLAAALTCTSYCGHNGKTVIPIEVETSRIGTCLTFSTGPMSMYQSLVVIRPKGKGKTMREVFDDAFGQLKKSYWAVIVPEPATGHLEHDASIFDQAPISEGHDQSHIHQ